VSSSPLWVGYMAMAPQSCVAIVPSVTSGASGRGQVGVLLVTLSISVVHLRMDRALPRESLWLSDQARCCRVEEATLRLFTGLLGADEC
jgi:hypothetical protein